MRPAYTIEGYWPVPVPDRLKPTAMSWLWSMAIAGIQRYCESGAKVPDWNTVGDVSGLWISYQRTPLLLPATTVWLTSNVV